MHWKMLNIQVLLQFSPAAQQIQKVIPPVICLVAVLSTFQCWKDTHSMKAWKKSYNFYKTDCSITDQINLTLLNCKLKSQNYNICNLPLAQFTAVISLKNHASRGFWYLFGWSILQCQYLIPQNMLHRARSIYIFLTCMDWLHYY